MPDMPCTRDVSILDSLDLTPNEPNNRRWRLVLGSHQRPRLVCPEIAPPGLGDPVGIRVLQRRLLPRLFAERLDERPSIVCEAPQDGVRKGHSPFEPGTADELDRFVDGRVPGYAVEIRELKGTESKCRPDGRVEPMDGTSTDRPDCRIEGSHALHGAVGELARQSAITVVERRGRRSEGTIGVGLVLEDPADDVERRGSSGSDRRSHQRSPRNQDAASMRLPPSG